MSQLTFKLAQQRIQESALILWAALETQRDPGINWQVLDAMDDALAALLPFNRHTVKTRTREGLFLVNVYRRFCPDKCEHMLNSIGFPDVMQHLHTEGYEKTKQAFIMLASQYAQAQQSLRYYAR